MRVALEDVLRAVAVVHVVVDDRHLVRAERPRVRRADGDVVEQAEPHRAAAFRVVPRRPHERRRRDVRRRHHPLDGIHHRAGGQERDLV